MNNHEMVTRFRGRIEELAGDSESGQQVIVRYDSRLSAINQLEEKMAKNEDNGSSKKKSKTKAQKLADKEEKMEAQIKKMEAENKALKAKLKRIKEAFPNNGHVQRLVRD